MNKIKYFYCGGDIHGDWRPVRNWVVNELSTPKKESALILLGDVGANYFLNERDKEFKRALNKLEIKIYCLRGNHEMRISDARNYYNFETNFYDYDIGGKVAIECGYPYIRYLADDGGLYKINNHSILTIPGAYSVDKFYRIQNGLNWFSNEQLNQKECFRLLYLAMNNHCDYILAHTCPYSWEKYINDLFLNGLDQSMIDKTTEKFLDEIVKDNPYEHFYFGHFHDDRDIPEVKATMLYKKFILLGEYINKASK